MINTIIGGSIALVSGIVIGTLTPSINSQIKKRNVINQKFLELISILFLIKNNLINYLHQYAYIEIIGEYEAGEDNVLKLKIINDKITTNIERLYQVQQVLILSFRKESPKISLISEKLDELESFIWNQKMNFNEQNTIYDQESSDQYTEKLNKMI